MNAKVLFSVLVLFSLLTSCNMPTGQITITQPTENQPVSLDPNAMATAVELTAVARVTQLAGSAVPATPTSTVAPTATSTPTTVPVSNSCSSPMVTANVVANVRSGPDTVYDIVGSLSVGQTATIVGRNDAYTWWYIDYPGVSGNHAWISGSVVTASCVPAVVQVVAAPSLPTSTATEVANNLLPLQPLNPNLSLQLLMPDLTIVNLGVPSSVPSGDTKTISVTVKNIGTADAGSFVVAVWDNSNPVCKKTVTSLAAGASKTVSCPHPFSGVGEHTVKSTADSGATVAESKENNNASQETVQVTIKFILKPTLPPLQFP